MYRKLSTVILSILLILAAAVPVPGLALPSLAEPVFAASVSADTAYSKTQSYLTDLADSVGWTEDTSWIILGLARAGKLTEAQGAAYAKNIANSLQKNGSARMDKNQSSTNSKTILALTAAGYDITDVAGYDLRAPLANISYVRKQGMNGPVWALLAFDSGAYEIPAGDKPKLQTTRESLVTSILGSQRSDHGWAYSGSSSDVDMTCMALQALAPYYSGSGAMAGEISAETQSKVVTAVDQALEWLSSVQKKDGSFSSIDQVCSESVSQVLVALTSLGIDPAGDQRFLKNGKGALDGLLRFYVTGGGFKHVDNNYKADVLASMQGYYALAAEYRFDDGKTSLYDMTDTQILYKAEADPADPDDPGDEPGDNPGGDDPGDNPGGDDSGDNPGGDNPGEEPGGTDDPGVAPGTDDAQDDQTGEDGGESGGKQDGKSGKSGKQDGKSGKSGKSGDQSGKSGKSGDQSGKSGKSGDQGSKSGKSGQQTSKDGKSGSQSGKDQKTAARTPSGKTAGGGSMALTKGGKVKLGEKGEEKTVSKIETVLKKAEKAVKDLPKKAADYSTKDRLLITDVYKAFLALSEAEQKAAEKDDRWAAYMKVAKKLGKTDHKAAEGAVDLTDNPDESLPWYIRMIADPYDPGAEKETILAALGEDGVLYQMYDIHFINTLDGKEWVPEDILTVRLLLPEDFAGEPAAVHLTKEGKVELLEAGTEESKDGKQYLSFLAAEFSPYGAATVSDTLESLMNESSEPPAEEKTSASGMLPWLAGGGAGLLALLALFIARRRTKDEQDE